MNKFFIIPLFVIGILVLFILFEFPTNPLVAFTNQLKASLKSSNFSPSVEIAQLATEASMTDKAKQIFYASQPEIDTDRTTFEQHCQTTVSSTAVELGCYTSDNRIYLLRITQPELQQEMVVTAAHEMLHAAYATLSPDEKATLTQELEAEIPNVRTKDLTRELHQYHLTEPGQRDNELHSILGTEYPNPGTALENHYSEYFTNRSLIVGYAQQFNQVFTQLQNTLTTLLNQIKLTKKQLKGNLWHGNISSYNSLVAQIQSLVQQYNQDVSEYNSLSRSLLGQETAN